MAEAKTGSKPEEQTGATTQQQERGGFMGWLERKSRKPAEASKATIQQANSLQEVATMTIPEDTATETPEASVDKAQETPQTAQQLEEHVEESVSAETPRSEALFSILQTKLKRRRFLALAGAFIGSNMVPSDFRVGITRPLQSSDMLLNPHAYTKESPEEFIEETSIDYSWNAMTAEEQQSMNNSKEAWEYAFSGFARVNEIFFRNEPETAIFDHVHDMCRKMDIPLAVGMLFLNHSGQAKGAQIGDILQSTIQAGLGGVSEIAGTREEVATAIVKQRRWGELLSSRLVSSHRTTGVMDTEEIVKAHAFRELPEDIKEEMRTRENGKYTTLLAHLEAVTVRSAAVEQEKGHLREEIDHLIETAPDILQGMFSDTATDDEWSVVSGTPLAIPSSFSRFALEAIDTEAPPESAITKTREFWIQQYEKAENKTDVIRSFMMEQWRNKNFWTALGDRADACKARIDSLDELYAQLHDANIASVNSGASFERDWWIEYTLALAIARRNIRIATNTLTQEGLSIDTSATVEGTSNLATLALLPRDAIAGYEAVQELGISLYNPLEDAPVFPYEISTFTAQVMKDRGITQPVDALNRETSTLGNEIFSVYVYQRELKEFSRRAKKERVNAMKAA